MAPPRRDMRMPGAAEMAARMKRMCEEHYAREVGHLAYLEARLKLTQPTTAVRALEGRASSGHRQTARKLRRINARHNTGQHPSAGRTHGPRRNHAEKRLADLEADARSLRAFYNGLTPQQTRNWPVAMRRTEAACAWAA